MTAKRPAILVSSHGHYSISRAMGILGLGTKAIRQVPVNEKFRMTAAAARLVGRHDFAAFQCAGGDVKTTERTILSATVLSHAEAGEAPLITCEVRGDGFLRHMVRTLVGTLVEVGRRRGPVSWVDEVLASRTRGMAGMTAPAAGLFLVSVDYE